MNISRVDPLMDERWKAFVTSHPDGSVFHTRAWLEALRRTYDYEPVVYAIDDGSQIVSAIPFCLVKSFITGRRLVSLPFSDHCQPLIAQPGHLAELLLAAESDARRDRLKYVEIRPLQSAGCAFPSSDRVVVHKLDISPSEEDLLQRFHPNHIRRNISKAGREQLKFEEGRSEELLRTFYRLFLMTRRRHGIPPQPLCWFRNLIECLGERLTISVALKDNAAIASIITLSFKNTILYKYGCSDPKYKPLGGTVFLLWRSIRRAKKIGLTELDLGRSDYSTPGLIAFKDRWGASQIAVNYYRSGSPASRGRESRLASAAKRLLISVPDPMFSALGGLLYRHVG